MHPKGGLKLNRNRMLAIGLATFAVVGTVAWAWVWIPFLLDKLN